jgi:hypothetical protein
LSKYWFKPKRYGLGAAPSSWEGWALLAAYIAAMFANAFLLGVDPHAGQPHPLAFIVIAFVLTLFFVVISWRKTEGGFRWRWGGD